jgi:hypothetical protein
MEEAFGTKSSYLEKAGQGISPEGKARGKNETPTGQNLDSVGGQGARGRQERGLKVQGEQHLSEKAKPNAARKNSHGENYQ